MAFAAEVAYELGVFRGEALEFVVESDTDAGLEVYQLSWLFTWSSGRVFGAYALVDEVLGEDLLDDGLAHEDTGWVTDPANRSIKVSILSLLPYSPDRSKTHVLNWR